MQTNKKNKTSRFTLTNKELSDIIQDSVNRILNKVKEKFGYYKQKRDSRGRFLPKYKTIAWFSYHKSRFPYDLTDRKVEVSEMNEVYIKGIDKKDNKYKCFRIDRIAPNTLATRKYRI